MTRTDATRPIPLGLTLLIAIFAALVALAVSGGHDAHAHGAAAQDADVHSHEAVGRTMTRHEFDLRTEMRRLWEDHVTWTRVAVISLTSGSPDTDASVARLLRNQTDIGNAVKPFYGAAAGNELTRLLREHITIAADVIAAAKAGDQAGLTRSQAAWQQNADRIAAFLAGANPRDWKLGEMRSMLRRHLTLTTAEVVARLQGHWAADVRAYDRIHAQALGMADMLSTGLVRQFPERFR